MKKYLSLLVALVLVFALAACGGGTSTPPASGSASTPSGSSASASGTTGADYADTKLVLMVSAFGDLSYMDAAKAGVEQLGELGFKTQFVECGEDSSKYEAYVLDICDSDADYLICGATYKDYVEAAAPNYPDMRFILFDTARDIENPLSNIYYISYAQNEGSYLVGMIAAAMSKSGVIGTIGGMQNPTICDFMTGYMAGAAAYNPDIKVVMGFMGNWTDTALMQELYTTQYNTYKADVVFPLSGNAGVGAFEAAHKLGTLAIGVDSDQYQLYSDQGNAYADVIITSMLKEAGNSIYSSIMRIFAGENLFGTAEVLGLSTGSVGYVDNDHFRSLVPAEVIAQVEETAGKIADGEITVPSYYDFANEEAFTEFATSYAP